MTITKNISDLTTDDLRKIHAAGFSDGWAACVAAIRDDLNERRKCWLPNGVSNVVAEAILKYIAAIPEKKPNV